LHPFQRRQLVSQLNQGAVIAYPTETVWGLGCLPTHPQALAHLAGLKQRSLKKGFILVSPNIELCLPFIQPKFHALAQKNMVFNKQHPTTWLLPKSEQLSVLISGKFNTVAIRISPHPFIQQICLALQMPLVSTSANMHSRPSLNSALLVNRFLGNGIDHIVNGYENGSGHASTIIDAQSNQIIRA
jgi:L-threonylcarbamoyladenylate synthase